jgi:hypothetical protein
MNLTSRFLTLFRTRPVDHALGPIDHWIRVFVESGASAGQTEVVSNCVVDYSSYKHTAVEEATVIITLTFSLNNETTGKEIRAIDSDVLFTIIRQQDAWVVDGIE